MKFVLIFIIVHGNDMDNLLPKIVNDMDSLHVEIEKQPMNLSGVLVYKRYKLGYWVERIKRIYKLNVWD